MAKFIKGSEKRTADHPVEKIFVDRWSPRAMSGESITDQELNRLFEAARWAPSSFNEQPWRFLYAKRNTPDFQKFLDLLALFFVGPALAGRLSVTSADRQRSSQDE